MRLIVDNVENVDKFDIQMQCMRKNLVNTKKVPWGG